ncbi:lysozyme inhibitor LprI family protein [uncultured Nitrosomonas sp.]|uniref:lysozyme inhibitor LprI family protein n=1 Tax=uncultured Nitrosomonas sp. TaxID=156424 RepID=UPI0025FFC144|nr:lysozyme inhibitor LprI family protein [uncultured Nitrosomonas sp.]
MHTGLLLVQQKNAVEERLVSKHHELVKIVSSSSSAEIKVDERLLAALKTQQSAWLKYRTEECELIGSLTGAGGTWPSTHANRCEVNHTEQRLDRVRSAIRCIEKIPIEKRLFEQNNCLQQLAPLTNK